MISPTGRITPPSNPPLHNIYPGMGKRIQIAKFGKSSFLTPSISTLAIPPTADELSSWLGLTIQAPWSYTDLLTTATVMLSRFLGRQWSGVRMGDYKVGYTMTVNMDPEKLTPVTLREVNTYFEVQRPDGAIPFCLKTSYLITSAGVFCRANLPELVHTGVDHWDRVKRMWAKRIRFQAVRAVLNAGGRKDG